MQKQKTIAKWLAIILLSTIMIGGYLVYDAIVSKPENTALGETGQTKSDDIPKKEKYHTILPRECENIDGIKVAHIGGENDETIKKVVAYNGNFFVFFESLSTEFDIEKSGLNMAYFSGQKLESVQYITDAEFADCKLMQSGICLVTKGEKNNAYIINQFGEIVAKNTTPDFDECALNLNGISLEIFYLKNDKLMMATIQNNLDFSTSNFVFNAENCTIKNVLSTSKDVKIILENSTENGNTQIVGFSHNKGFTLDYYSNKTSFVRLFTLGDLETNYILCGKSQGKIVLFSLDNNFTLTAKKTLDEDDGIIISNGTNMKVVCPDFTYEFCRHLDLQSKQNSVFSNGEIKFSNDKFFVSENNGYDTVFTSDNTQIVKMKSSQNYRLIESETSIFIFLETSSNEGVFRANFGGNDIYFLALDKIDC